MVKIRLTRGGSNKRPYYRVTVIDQRKRRDGRPLEFLGTYDPKPEAEVIKLDIEGIEKWVAKGAQVSETVTGLIKKQRRAASAS